VQLPWDSRSSRRAAEEGIQEGVFSSDTWGGNVRGCRLSADLEPIPPPVAAWAETVHAGT
jgi:hypothetical protein